MAGALVRPNNITTYSNKPIGVKKAVLCSWPSFMRTWWYAEDRSTALNIQALPSLLRRLCICSIGNMSKHVCLFKLQKLIHMRSSPVFLSMKRMGTPYGDTLGLIQPFANISSMCHCTTSICLQIDGITYVKEVSHFCPLN